jgi:hypothetical protein
MTEYEKKRDAAAEDKFPTRGNGDDYNGAERFGFKAGADWGCAAAIDEIYQREIEYLKNWAQYYSTELFTEKPPYKTTDSAAAAMGRHILGKLISRYENALKHRGYNDD